MKTVYIVYGGPLYGTILYGIYEEEKDAKERTDALISNLFTYRVEQRKRNQAAGYSDWYWDSLTEEQIFETCEDEYNIEPIILNTETEAVLYAE